MTEFARTVVISEQDFERLPTAESGQIDALPELFDENDTEQQIAEKLALRINRLYLKTKADRFTIGRLYNIADARNVSGLMSQFINDQIVSVDTMRKYGWVERAVPAEQVVEYTVKGETRVANLRELPLSFSHYEKVARFRESPEVLARLLIEAMELELSITQFNAHIDRFLQKEDDEREEKNNENDDDQELEFVELSVPRFAADKLTALADRVDLTPHEVLVALINLYGEQYIGEYQDEHGEVAPF